MLLTLSPHILLSSTRKMAFILKIKPGEIIQYRCAEKQTIESVEQAAVTGQYRWRRPLFLTRVSSHFRLGRPERRRPASTTCERDRELVRQFGKEPPRRQGRKSRRRDDARRSGLRRFSPARSPVRVCACRTPAPRNMRRYPNRISQGKNSREDVSKGSVRSRIRFASIPKIRRETRRTSRQEPSHRHPSASSKSPLETEKSALSASVHEKCGDRHHSRFGSVAGASNTNNTINSRRTLNIRSPRRP